MRSTAYTWENLRNHTATIQGASAVEDSAHFPLLRDSFVAFDIHLQSLEALPSSLVRNVGLLLACKLLNHVYSSLLLVERGLLVDAILCARNGLETVAFHWLTKADPASLEEYHSGRVPPPVEVRKRLEGHNVDIEPLRSIYKSASEITHVGRNAEYLHLEWSTDSDAQVFFGGTRSEKDQEQHIRFPTALLHLFIHGPFLIGDKNGNFG